MDINQADSKTGRRTKRRQQEQEKQIAEKEAKRKEILKRLKRKTDEHQESSENDTPAKRRNKKTQNDQDENSLESEQKLKKQKKSRVFRKKERDQIESSEQYNKSQKSYRPSLKQVIISIGIVFVLALITYTTILYGGKLIADENKLIISPPTTIETTDGEIIWYLYDEYRLPVELKQVPEHVQDAFIAIEDKRFYSHSGVDLRSIARAVYVDIVARDKKEGASTITQQLAKNLYLTNDKSWLRKIKEAMIALYLEREFSKDDLLEMYLNIIYFGQGQYGIEAAANRYFHKSVEDLTLEEGALLAGMIKGPNGYSPVEHPEKALNRRNLVLETMHDLDYISKEEMVAAQQKAIQLDITTRKNNPTYHTIADLVIKEAEDKYGITLEELKESRYRIITSLDKEIQEIAYDQFQYDGYFPGNDKETVEGAFVMMNEKNGEIVAALGGRRYEFGNLNRIFVKRQPGSTMKPIAVYAPALESGEFTPYSMLPDEMREWGGHEVRNYDDVYEGNITLFDAIKWSKNTTATWLLNEMGVNYSKKFLTKMNVSIEDNDLSIALGALEHGLTPLQMVETYRTFVHGGERIAPHMILEIYNRKGQITASAMPETDEVFSEQVAWNMTEMLKGVVQGGTGRTGYYPHELAGKTGSTQHDRAEGNTKDAWFVGFTPEYVTALWMGYDKSDENHYLTGGSGYPTELTKKILTEVDKRKSLQTTFTKPENVQALAEPIQLPEITDLVVSYTFGGLKLLKGKLQWTGANDARIVYQIFEQDGDHVEKIGEVTGENQFIIDEFMLFKHRTYFVIPYNPLTEQEGTKSNTIDLP